MPVELQPSYDSLDQVPEAARGSYVEEGGRAIFSKPLTVETLPEVAGLKSTMEKGKRRIAELETKIKEFDGFDRAQYEQDKQELETLRASKGGDKTETERAINTLKDSHKKEIEKLTGTIGGLNTKLQTLLKTTVADGAMGKYDAIPKLLRPHVLSQTEIIEEDGEPVVQVVDERGKPRYSKTTGERMTVDELVAEMKESDDYKGAFRGTGAGGGGHDQGRKESAGGGKIRTTRADFEANYRKYKEAAAKLGKDVGDYVVLTD